MYAWKLIIMKKSIHINCLMEMLCDKELNFFTSGTEKEMKERNSDRKRIGLEDWVSKFGDRNLTIGKSRLESLVQSKTQLREIREKRELLWEKRKRIESDTVVFYILRLIDKKIDW